MNIGQKRAVVHRTTVERKHSSLPRYLVFPERLFTAWRLAGSTTVEVEIGGERVGRRTLKKWGKGIEDWFIDLPDAACKRLRIDTGDRVEVSLVRASEDLPGELLEVLDRSAAARKAWEAMTASQKRALREHVLAAKKSETRARRARMALL